MCVEDATKAKAILTKYTAHIESLGVAAVAMEDAEAERLVAAMVLGGVKEAKMHLVGKPRLVNVNFLTRLPHSHFHLLLQSNNLLPQLQDSPLHSIWTMSCRRIRTTTRISSRTTATSSRVPVHPSPIVSVT